MFISNFYKYIYRASWEEKYVTKFLTDENMTFVLHFCTPVYLLSNFCYLSLLVSRFVFVFVFFSDWTLN